MAAMNPNNAEMSSAESKFPIPVSADMPSVSEASPEDMGKALQLRHETRIALREEAMPETIPLLSDDTPKEPIRLNFDDESGQEKRKKRHKNKAARLVGKALGTAVGAAAVAAHTKVRETEKDNSAVKGAHETEILTEVSARAAARGYLKHRDKRQERLYDEPKYSQNSKKNPTESYGTGSEKKKPHRKEQQKERIKREYRIAARSKARGTTSAAQKSAKAAVGKADKVKELATTFFKNNKGLFYALIGLGLLFLLMMIGLGSCSSMFAGASTPIITTTYPSKDEEMLATEDRYCDLETALERQISRTRTQYPGYASYTYHLDEIKHDPYPLISYLSVKYGNFTYNDIQNELQEIFREQYTLSCYSVSERVSYTETIYTGDPPTAKDLVRYRTIYHLHIVLTDNGLDAVLRSRMSAEEQELYDLYNTTYGNRKELFEEN